MKRSALLVPALVAVAATVLPPPARAIPNVFFGNGFIGPIVPAFPRFNANLTRDFLAAENWRENQFPGPWEDAADETPGARRMTAMPVLFGAVPMAVTAHASQTGVGPGEIEIVYLDAGRYFGYLAGGEKTRDQRDAGETKRDEFDRHFRRLADDLRQRLDTGCGAARRVVLGRSDLLRETFSDYRCDAFTLRLLVRDGHSVALRLFPAGSEPRSLVAGPLEGEAAAARANRLAENTRSNPRGDLVIDGVPMFAQQTTPFCGVHSLAMAARYFGLELRPGDLAAAAEFKNTGSARGSRLLDLHHAAAEEIGMNLKVSSRFDFDRVARAVREGRPVIVWRRVSLDREKARLIQMANLGAQPLPTLSQSVRDALPPRDKKGSPSHASIVTGINEQTREVLYTEPWGDATRNLRMRGEELADTVYAAFFFES
ncbi:MAG: C39 family peptidase [Verrucomicrobiae bacterium]|nr:C39 family peptidase [Verrucomicrobiae bacterium]MCP5541109.1 C39 family peptidase [Akkermansiaceae bacterium]